jgi:hypothetical protein
MVAVSIPVASFWPVATTQVPGTTAARLVVEVLLMVVVLLYRTVVSPLAPVRMRV